MRFYNILIFVIFGSCSLWAQQKYVDLNISASYNPGTIEVGETTELEIIMYNAGIDDIVESGYAWVNITLPPNVLFIHEPRTDKGDWFDYFELEYYDPLGGLVYFLNKSPILSIWNGLPQINFYFSVDGLGENPPALTTAISTGILPVAVQNGYIEDLGGNDTQCGVEILLSPLPVTLSSFSGSSIDCGQIDLTWTTQSESNNDYIEIQRSTDGRVFESIGRVKGLNNPTGGKYSYSDTHELKSGEKYFYRLRQVDFDGKEKFHKVIVVENRCYGGKPDLSIYPNPAMDKVNFLLTNLEPGEYKGIIINRDGAEVRQVTLSPESAYEMELKDLAPGVYNLRILDQQDNLTKSFIRIR